MSELVEKVDNVENEGSPAAAVSVPSPLSASALKKQEREQNPWTAVNRMLCNNRCFICTQGFPRGKKKKVFMVSQILQSFTAIYASKEQMQPPLQQQEEGSETAQERAGYGSTGVAGGGIEPESSYCGLEQQQYSELEKQQHSLQQGEGEGEGMAPAVASSAWSLQGSGGMDPRLILFINCKEQCPHVWACWQSFYSLAGSSAREQELVDLLASVDVQVWMSGLACCRSDTCAAMYRAITSDNSKNELIASILASKEKFTHKDTFCPPDCDCDSPWQFMNL